MKYIMKRYKSALVMHIMLVQIHATYSFQPIQRNFLQQNGRNVDIYSHQNPQLVEIYYKSHNIPMKDILFLRKAKSGTQPRLLNIDLSALRQDKELPAVHANSRHKSPVNLMGIDISALSRNPDPTLPIAIVHPKNILNGKSVMSYDFDFKYDRLPVIKSKPIHPLSPIAPQSFVKPETVLPIMHIPLKVMTTYHSILTNKKQDIGFDFNSRSSNDLESEQKYTANFILQLLYQLSSNYGKNYDD